MTHTGLYLSYVYQIFPETYWSDRGRFEDVVQVTVGESGPTVSSSSSASSAAAAQRRSELTPLALNTAFKQVIKHYMRELDKRQEAGEDFVIKVLTLSLSLLLFLSFSCYLMLVIYRCSQLCVYAPTCLYLCVSAHLYIHIQSGASDAVDSLAEMSGQPFGTSSHSRLSRSHSHPSNICLM